MNMQKFRQHSFSFVNKTTDLSILIKYIYLLIIFKIQLADAAVERFIIINIIEEILRANWHCEAFT